MSLPALPDDWSSAGIPHPWWDRYTSPVVLSYGRFDLSYSGYGLLLMAHQTPAWREVYIRIADELTFHQLARGADLQAVGYDADDADAVYHVWSRQAFIWPYDSQARLIGENLYEDKTSLELEEVSPDEAITPERVREIHREQLAKLEAERGESFWVLGADA